MEVGFSPPEELDVIVVVISAGWMSADRVTVGFIFKIVEVVVVGLVVVIFTSFSFESDDRHPEKDKIMIKINDAAIVFFTSYTCKLCGG